MHVWRKMKEQNTPHHRRTTTAKSFVYLLTGDKIHTENLSENIILVFTIPFFFVRTYMLLSRLECRVYIIFSLAQ